MAATIFPSLSELAQHLRTELAQKKCVLLYAFNPELLPYAADAEADA